MSKGLRWDFHFTPLRDADSISSGSSRAWGDLSNNIDGLTKKMQKWASDPNDEYFKKEFSKLSPEEQLNVMQRGDFIPEEYAKRVSPEMRDRYRLNNPEQSMIWQNQLAQMQQQKQNAEIQKYGFNRTQLADNRADALRAFEQSEFAHKRAVDEAIASGDRARINQALNAQNDFRQQAMLANEHVNVSPLSHKDALDASNNYNAAELVWSTADKNKRVDALIPELIQLLGEAAPGSDAANVILQRMQQSSTPEQWHDITLAYQKMMNTGLAAHTVPSLIAQANAAEDAEDAMLRGGSPAAGGGIPVESKGAGNNSVGSGTNAFSQMANESPSDLSLRPLTVNPLALNTNNANEGTNRDEHDPYFKVANELDASTEKEKRRRNELKIEQEWEDINKRENKKVVEWKEKNDQLHKMLEHPNMPTPYNTFPRSATMTRETVAAMIAEHEKQKPASLKGEEVKKKVLEDIAKYKQDSLKTLPIDAEWNKVSDNYFVRGYDDNSLAADQLKKAGMPLLADKLMFSQPQGIITNPDRATLQDSLLGNAYGSIELPPTKWKARLLPPTAEETEAMKRRADLFGSTSLRQNKRSDIALQSSNVLSSMESEPPTPEPPSDASTKPTTAATLDFEGMKKGNWRIDKPEDMTYGKLLTTIPVSQMSLGQVTDELQPALIKETRDNQKYQIYRDREKVGTSAVGIGQFLKSTIEELAPKVFGKDWKNVIFTRENQEKLLRARYDQALNSKQIPGVVWEGLEKTYGGKKGFEWVRMKGGFKHAPPYEEVRKLILETESAFDGTSSSSSSSFLQEKPEKSYSELLPDVLTGYFIAAEKLQNGERSDALTSFMNAAKSNKSALDILNEYAKANVNLKYGKDDNGNTFPFRGEVFQTLVNSTREKLAKEGISVKPAQVAQLILNSVQLEQGKLWGRGDKIKIDEKALLNRTREMYKASVDPERQLTERIHNEYISVAPMVERFQHLNKEITKMESRTVQNAGSKRQLDKAKQKREELAKQVVEQLHKLQGSWGLAKLSNQGD